MNFKQTPELAQFLSTAIFDSDHGAEEQAVQAFAQAASPDLQKKVLDQLKLAAAEKDLSVEEIGNVANRWFGEAQEARDWFLEVLQLLERHQKTSPDDASVAVLDSNGTPLSEGDSVTVIKDLKVKGGSSDLKRGTMIRKIHLIGDPDNIECRVDGSTLVLKTCFLKKA